MATYKLKVLQDGSDDVHEFLVESCKPIDHRLLQLAGLILDHGISPDALRRELPTAQAYVDVCGKIHREKWVDEAISN